MSIWIVEPNESRYQTICEAVARVTSGAALIERAASLPDFDSSKASDPISRRVVFVNCRAVSTKLLLTFVEENQNADVVVCGKRDPTFEACLKQVSGSGRVLALAHPFFSVEVELLLSRLFKPVSLASTSPPTRSAGSSVFAAAEALLSSARDVLYVCRPDGTIRFVSGAFVHNYQLPIAHFVQSYEEAFVLQEQNDTTRALRYLEIPKEDGTTFSLELVEQRLPEQSGEGFLGIARDVTQRSVLESELRRIQKLDALRRMAGGLAHELNDLLTVIGGEADMLMDTAHADAARIIVETTERAADLTGRLMLFGQEVATQGATLDLSDLVRHTLRLFGRMLPKTIRVDLDLCPEAPVRASSSELTTVLLNLLTNAGDAMPLGGTLRLTTACLSADSELSLEGPDGLVDSVVLSVEDNGAGMSKDIQQLMFDPFFSTKVPGQPRGLGLSVVYGIVQRLGGMIRVYSEVGLGTRIDIVLPQFDAVDARVRPPESERRGHGKLILLVEDDPRVRSLTLRVLQRAGFQVLAVGEPTEALSLDDKVLSTVSMMVSDVIMPRLSGPELYEKLKDRRSDLRAIFVTGYAAEHLGSEVFEGTGFLRKPWKRDDLLAAIDRCLSG